MSRVVVIDTLLHAGLERQPGDEIDLEDEAQIERLIEEGRVAKPNTKDAKAAKQDAEAGDEPDTE